MEGEQPMRNEHKGQDAWVNSDFTEHGSTVEGLGRGGRGSVVQVITAQISVCLTLQCSLANVVTPEPVCHTKKLQFHILQH